MTIYEFPNGEEAALSLPQLDTLDRFRNQMIQYGRITAKDKIIVTPVFFGDGAVMIDYAGMKVGIETDGYAHS